MKRVLLGIAVLVCAPLAVAGHGFDNINGSIHIDAGQQVGDLESINGSVHLGADARAEEIATVNGGVMLAARAQAREIENVNGSVELQDGARVADDIESVNGSVTLFKGAEVGGSVGNVNGRIELQAAHVGGIVSTVNGDLEIGPNSRVDGGIRVEKPNGNTRERNRRVPRVVIGPNAVVSGPLVFEHEVELYVSDRATIGPVEGAQVRTFQGDRP